MNVVTEGLFASLLVVRRLRAVSLAVYTFYPVRWATQKGDILRVCVEKVAHLGGGQF